MAIPSKWDQECKLCGATWKKGDMIDKQPSGKWCTNPNCVDTSNPQQTIPTQQPAQQNQNQNQSQTQAPQSREERLAALKSACMTMSGHAMDVADMGVARYFKDKSGADQRDRNIMWQVIYKECMAALRESKA